MITDLRTATSATRMGTIVAVWTTLLACVGSANRPTLGQQPPTADPAPPSVAAAPADIAVLDGSLGGLIATIIRENLPDQYEARDHWGDTKEVWAGLDIRREGWEIKTKRRKKQVNHGTWKLYRVRVVEPDKYLHVEVRDVRALPGGRVEFELLADAKLDVFARLSQWELGVQLISLSVNAEARTQFHVRCNLGLSLDPTKLPPDVLLDPQVSQADLRLVDFRVARISQIGGSVAHELGDQSRSLLERELHKQNEKLPNKINRQIDKSRDKLRLSVAELLASRWGGLAAKQLGLDNATADPEARPFLKSRTSSPPKPSDLPSPP